MPLTRASRLINHERFVTSKYFILLLTLMLSILTDPIFHNSPSLQRLSQITYLLIFLGGISAVAKNKKQLKHALILFGISAGLNIFYTWSGYKSQTIAQTTMIFYGIFFNYYIYMILKDVMSSQQITSDTLCGSACAYILIALGFTILYKFLEFVHPSSFNFPGDVLEPNMFLYFSFMTQTTVGYGDVTPATALARSMVIVQATIGVFYMAVLVSHLVGNMMSRSHK